MPNVTSSFYSTEHWSTAAAEGIQTPSPGRRRYESGGEAPVHGCTRHTDIIAGLLLQLATSKPGGGATVGSGGVVGVGVGVGPR